MYPKLKVFCLQFTITFVAYKNTITRLVSSIRDSLAREITTFSLFLFASPFKVSLLTSPTNSRSVISLSTLNNIGSTNAIVVKVSHDSHPPNGWYHDLFGYYQYYINNRWTEITIRGLDHLYLEDTQHHYHMIVLKHPCYCISFKDKHLVDSPTLKQAKELAEWYYKKWVAVCNSSSLTQHINTTKHH